MNNIDLMSVRHLGGNTAIDIDNLAQTAELEAKIAAIREEAVANAVSKLVAQQIGKMKTIDLLELLDRPEFQDTNAGNEIASFVKDINEKLKKIAGQQKKLKERLKKIQEDCVAKVSANFNAAYPTDEKKVQVLSVLNLKDAPKGCKPETDDTDSPDAVEI